MKRKISVIFVLLVVILGSLFYFTTDAVNKANSMNAESIVVEASLFKDMQLKAAYTDEGTIDIFALAKNNALAKIPAVEGNSIPEQGGLVLGNEEGSMMREEGEFRQVGDELVDYGVTLRVDGVLSKTETFADDFHFLNNDVFAELPGDLNALRVEFKDEKTPKLFFIYNDANPSPVNMVLSSGDIALFSKQEINGRIYFPLLIGSKEAQMMQEEKLFTSVDDTLNGFFGRDVIIVGIIAETNTSIDMMHIVEPDFFEVDQ